jgi:succinate dehydrogenase / fumarate reductase cytochrome b subunit
MTTTTHDTVTASPASPGLLASRVGSFLAFAPLGVWVTWHIWENLSAWRGAEAWEATVTTPTSPLTEVLVSVIVWVPIVLHTVWGLRRFKIMKPNLGRYRTFDNLKFVLQRISALGLLAFIPAHVWLARLYPLIKHGRHETFADISFQMRHHLPTLVVYLLGTLGAAYHLANGLQTGGMTWGYAASPLARRRMSFISITFFLVLLAMSWGAVYALWDHGAQARQEQRGYAPTAVVAPAP